MNGSTTVRLPWGTELDISAGESIGRSLLASGVYDLAVSETLWRLTDPSESCLDIGANIGYMTSLLAVRADVTGTVYGFEPHPQVFLRLKTNLQSDRHGTPTRQQAHVVLIQIAIGEDDCEVDLVEPEGFETNQSGASITNGAPNWPLLGRKHRVQVQRLDSLFHQGEQFDVAKIDVEGAELAVLRGAENMIGGRKIRDIVFEDFHAFPSESVTLLRRHGYRVYRLGKSLLGPIIWDPSQPHAVDWSLPWEPVNYLGTLDPDRADRRLRPRGWHCLKAKR
jgi:FkbM family methyltransferase